MAVAGALALVGSVENSRRRRIDQEEDRQGREKDPPFYLRRDPETTNQSIQFFLFLFRFCCCFFFIVPADPLLIVSASPFFWVCLVCFWGLFSSWTWSRRQRGDVLLSGGDRVTPSISFRPIQIHWSWFNRIDSSGRPSMTSMNSFKHFRNRCWRLSNRWIYRPAAFVSWASPSPIDRMAPAEEEEEKEEEDIFIGSYF